MAVNVEQRRVLTNLPVGIEGRITSPPYLTETANHPTFDGEATQTYSILVSAAGADFAYSYEVAGEPIIYDGLAADTDEDVAVGLADAHNANIIARGAFLADVAESDPGVSGIDTLVLTPLQPFQEVEVTTSDANLTLTEDAAFEPGDSIPVASAVYLVDGILTLTKPTGNIEDVLYGAVAYTYEEGEQQVGGGPIPASVDPRRQAYVMRRGVMIYTAPDAEPRGVVYVGTGTNDEQGKFFTEAGADRTALPVSAAEWDGPNKLRLKLV